MGTLPPTRANVPGLDGLTIAVTGAAGFFGGRLLEILAGSTGARIVAMLRSLQDASRLPAVEPDRLRVEAVDMSASAPRHGPGAPADVMVHCAFGNRGTARQRWRTTVDGTASALRLAKAKHVRRFVHVSTMAVYDLDASQIITEDSPPFDPAPGDIEYAAQKLCAEQLVFANAEALEVVVVQPTIVYGPNSLLWTIQPLARLAAESHLLPTGDAGVCNAVFVDDVVSALLLASVVPEAAGRRFLVSGPEPTSWGRFFDVYRDMAIPQVTAPQGGTLPEWERHRYASRTAVGIDRARQVLGYRPAYEFDEGIAVTRRWACQAGLAR